MTSFTVVSGDALQLAEELSLSLRRKDRDALERDERGNGTDCVFRRSGAEGSGRFFGALPEV